MVRKRGPHALADQATLPPARLTAEQLDRLRADLNEPPASFAYKRQHCSGALLPRHVTSRY